MCINDVPSVLVNRISYQLCLVEKYLPELSANNKTTPRIMKTKKQISNMKVFK